MSSEAGKPSSTKQLDRDLRDMVTSITNRTTDLHKSRPGHHGHEHDEDEHGASVITLAGHNTGATFRSELHDDDHHRENHRKHGAQHGGQLNGDQFEGMNTYLNSNFQAVNNSVMMGGSYTTNDPGVHLDINDFFEPHHGHGSHQGHGRPEKKGGKGKRKENENESDHHEEHM